VYLLLLLALLLLALLLLALLTLLGRSWAAAAAPAAAV
jgi:hypothetical protein